MKVHVLRLFCSHVEVFQGIKGAFKGVVEAFEDVFKAFKGVCRSI